MDLDSFIAEREGQRLTGVYALYDARRSLQYVGYARSIVLAIKVSLLLLLAAISALQGALQPAGCWLRGGALSWQLLCSSPSTLGGTWVPETLPASLYTLLKADLGPATVAEDQSGVSNCG